MEAIRAQFTKAGQGHLFARWDHWTAAEQAALLASLEQIDLDLVGTHRSLLQNSGGSTAAPQFEPPELFPAHPAGAQVQTAVDAKGLGEDLLRQGKVAYVLVAGGQGSRLGFDGPKGKFPVGPLTGKSLFAWHAARIQAAAKRYGRTSPWLIMTSATNDAETKAYFEEQAYFGLGSDQVHFFSQAMVPALDTEGRIVLSAPGEVFMAPNGHGGTLDALNRSGLLQKVVDLGVETLSYFQVDNPLARPADPLFLGLHAKTGANMSSKVVAKADPHEKVGVLGMADGVLGCIEYSDLPEALRDAQDPGGNLLFRAGNIAVHALQTEFVQELTKKGLDLPWHLARKNMPAMDESGQMQTIEGIKFETFIFDALAKSPKSVTLEVERALEFSPVKNAKGGDSPGTCRAHLTGLFDAWRARAKLPDTAKDGDGCALIEVDPTFAEDAQEFLARMPHSGEADGGGLLFR